MLPKWRWVFSLTGPFAMMYRMACQDARCLLPRHWWWWARIYWNAFRG